MPSFREVDSTIDYRSNDESRCRQQGYGRRNPRILERQMSDKHLKRRAQIIQLENNSSIRYLNQHGSPNNRSSLSLSDMNHQYETQYPYYRRSDRGGYQNRSFFRKLLWLVVIILIALITIWHFMLKSSGTTEKGKMASIIMGGNDDNEYDNGETNDTNRSYQDLADSIKRLRNRRQELKEEKAGEWGERKEVNHDNGVHHEADDDRMKRLEQKIQMEQNKKVRQELLLSIKNSHDHDIEENAAGYSNHQKQYERQHAHTNSKSTNTTALKDKVMSDIAALKLLKDKKKEENDSDD